MRAMDDLLVLFLPGRSRPGALAAAFAKAGLQFVEGCEEPAIRARVAGRQGLLLTLVGWRPAGEERVRGRARIVLPEAVVTALTAVAGSPGGDGGFELAVVPPGAPVRARARVDLGRLAGPLAIGCWYTVAAGPVEPVVTPPPPSATPILGAPGAIVDDE